MPKTYSTVVSPAAYFDHRKFLEAAVADLREQGVFSHRTFNRECGFSSPNFIQLVIQGKRNLSEEAALRIAKVLSLSKSDTKIFLRLHEMNLAKDPEARVELFQTLLRQPGFAKKHELAPTELSFYSKWYNVVIRELLQSHPQLTANDIAKALIPKISARDVETSLEEMVELGFIKRSKSGWSVRDQQMSTANEILHSALISFHSSMIDLARESLTRFRGDQREVSSVTLQLTEKEFLELREQIRELKRDALALEKTDPSAQVFQLNFQLFPVTTKL